MKQEWFDMQDLWKRKLNKSVWVPLRASKTIRTEIEFGKVGFTDEFVGHGSLMLPVDKRSVTGNITWNNLGSNRSNCMSYLLNEYETADLFRTENFTGIHLVLDQTFDNNYDNNEWHLNQDLVINLGLKREGDVWVCPRMGYVEVAKLERDEEGSPVLLQIKNQFLKDYLCARNHGLYITSYFSRGEIFEDRSVLSWNNDSKSVEDGADFWECRVREIHEGGFPYGEKAFVSHVGRTDIDENEDVPDMMAFSTDDNIKSESYEKSFNGKKLYHIIAELWKGEWISPAKLSPVVLGDEQSVELFFIIDAEGSKVTGKELAKGKRWLWFKPELIAALLSKRNSFLKWYTKDTGSVACAPSWGVHFGVNDLGLITAYAKDVCTLPLWQQQIWAAHNIPPEGGISKELHDSQVKAEPAQTLSPEAFLERAMKEINVAAMDNLGARFFRGHSSVDEILGTIHRFRAIDEKGLFSLAKDIARIIVDDIDVESLQKIAIPPKKVKWGSLKTVENLLSKKIPKEDARQVLSPFVGIYELRHGDAHLPSSDIEASFKLIELDRSLPFVIQGYQMIFACVDNLHLILRIIQQWDEFETNN